MPVVLWVLCQLYVQSDKSATLNCFNSFNQLNLWKVVSLPAIIHACRGRDWVASAFALKPQEVWPLICTVSSNPGECGGESPPGSDESDRPGSVPMLHCTAALHCFHVLMLLCVSGRLLMPMWWRRGGSKFSTSWEDSASRGLFAPYLVKTFKLTAQK